MKRAFIVFIMVSLVFAGCASGAKYDIVPEEAAKTILEGVEFRDTLIEAPGDVAEEWYGFDGKETGYAVYVSGSGATAEEIAVIKSSDVKSAKAVIEKRVEDLKFRFENYVPTEMTKLNDPVIVTKGDAVILVLADDTENARKVVDGLS